MSLARDVFKEAFVLYARNGRALLALTALMFVPLILVRAVSEPLLQTRLSGQGEKWLAYAGGAVVFVVELLVWAVTAGVLTLAVKRRLEGRPIVVRPLWREGLGRIKPVVTATLASFVPAVGWGILFIVPVVIAVDLGLEDHAPWLSKELVVVLFVLFMAVRLAFVTCVSMLEGVGGFAGYRRNLVVGPGHFWSRAAVFCTLAAVQMLLDAAVGAVFPEVLEPALRLAHGGLLLPFEVAATTLLYFRLHLQSPASSTR